MEIMSGKIKKAQKIVVYGPEGVGKSTFASKFPNPLFTDTEGSTSFLDVRRMQKPSSWVMLLEQARFVKSHPETCDTYVIDTADWSEQLCVNDLVARAPNAREDGIGGIEGFGYGKGYTYLAEEFGRLLNLLQEVVDIGINVVVNAHATMRKIERPEETGSYDHWELKLQKKTAPLLKEWADMVLFANYEIHVVNVDGQGAAKGKNKAQGGKRVMYTCHTPYWDAKNRHDLDYKLDFDFAKIAHCIPIRDMQVQAAPIETPKAEENIPASPPKPEPSKPANSVSPLKALHDLMAEYGVNPKEIQEAVSQKGYYPKDTPMQNYSEDFISGVLVGAWPKVHDMIRENRNNEIPF